MNIKLRWRRHRIEIILIVIVHLLKWLLLVHLSVLIGHKFILILILVFLHILMISNLELIILHLVIVVVVWLLIDIILLLIMMKIIIHHLILNLWHKFLGLRKLMRIHVLVLVELAIRDIVMTDGVLSSAYLFILMNKNSTFLKSFFNFIRDNIINFGEYSLIFKSFFVDSCEFLLIFKRSPISFPLYSTIHHFLIISFLNLSLTSFFGEVRV